MIIPCIHSGEKEDLTIEYFGKKKNIRTCVDCKENIKLLSNVKILEVKQNVSN